MVMEEIDSLILAVEKLCLFSVSVFVTILVLNFLRPDKD
jgi:hypothetical protein